MTRDERQAELKAAIDRAECVNVVAATAATGHYSMGDLCALGYAHKQYLSIHDGDIDDVRWFYCGPFPIIVRGCTVLPNEWVE